MNRKRGAIIIAVAVMLMLLLVSSYVYNSNSSVPRLSNMMKRIKVATPNNQVKSSATSGKVKCFQIGFSQKEVDNTCSQAVKRPLCLVNRIYHLNREEFVVARLTMSPGSDKLVMYVHPPWDMISKSILVLGSWELPIEKYMRAALLALPGAGLLDVGCQLGVYSLHAAQLGRKVVAIDAFYQNTLRLRASVVANGFEERVRVYWNALATEKGTMAMQMAYDCNIGGGVPLKKTIGSDLDSIDVRTSRLDDIVFGDNGFHGVKELIVKMDMEGNEWLVTATGSGVFKRFNVTMVIMEWGGTRKFYPRRAPAIIDFFKSHNLQPYKLAGATLHPLPIGDYMNWPWDILWLTNKFVKLNPLKL